MDARQTSVSPPLAPWMTRLLWFVGGYNLLAGLGMLCLYHEGFKLLGVTKPDFNLPIQLVGVLVGLFGVGYWMVAAHPVENRNILLLGFWSKLLGSVLGLYYVCAGKLPLFFLALLLVSDIGYLPPFYVILRQLPKAFDQHADHQVPAVGEHEQQQLERQRNHHGW